MKQFLIVLVFCAGALADVSHLGYDYSPPENPMPDPIIATNDQFSCPPAPECPEPLPAPVCPVAPPCPRPPPAPKCPICAPPSPPCQVCEVCAAPSADYLPPDNEYLPPARRFLKKKF